MAGLVHVSRLSYPGLCSCIYLSRWVVNSEGGGGYLLLGLRVSFASRLADHLVLPLHA
jgi:hypothetical protein